MAIKWRIPDKKGGSDLVNLRLQLPRVELQALKEYQSGQRTAPGPRTPNGTKPSLATILMTLARLKSPELDRLVRTHEKQS
jgi:hypothetical protein